MTIDKMFSMFDTDADSFMDIDELVAMLKDIGISVNQQLTRLLLAIFDKDNNQKIDLGEFKAQLKPYVVKAPIKAEQI